MCCFEHSYTGFFGNAVARKRTVLGVGIAEIVDRCFLAGIASLEFSSAIQDYLVPGMAKALILLSIYVLFGSIHCLIFRGPRLLCPQMILAAITKISLVLFCLIVSRTAKLEGWNASGLVMLTFLAISLIKLCSLPIAYYELVDMTSDYSYFVELGFGLVLLLISIVIEIAYSNDFTSTVIVASVVGTSLSLVTLLDLQQNMTVNSWWWEDKILDGCVYHVIRQFTTTCCLRIERQPNLVVYIGNPLE